MTTIVYRDGILAWDSRWTDDQGFVYDNRKGWRDNESGVIIAFAGAPGVAYEVLRNVLSDEEDEIKIKKDEDLDLVLLWQDGRLEVYDELGRCFPYDTGNFYAWGSGAKAALGALHMGATARGAIEMASKVDLYTGGPIHEESW